MDRYSRCGAGRSHGPERVDDRRAKGHGDPLGGIAGRAVPVESISGHAAGSSSPITFALEAIIIRGSPDRTERPPTFRITIVRSAQKAGPCGTRSSGGVLGTVRGPLLLSLLFPAQLASTLIRVREQQAPLSRGFAAEREGFEPPLPFQVNTLSRRAPSTTRPSLRMGGECSKKARPVRSTYFRACLPQR